MDPWAVIAAYPFVTLAGMGLIATTALWAGFVGWQARQDRLMRYRADLDELRRQTTALKGITNDLDRD